MKYTALLLLLPAAALASPLAQTEAEFGLGELGIQLYGTSEFYTVQDIGKTVLYFQDEAVSPSDYLYRGAFMVGQIMAIDYVAGRGASVLMKKASKKTLMRKGATAVGLKAPALLIGESVLQKSKASPIARMRAFISSHETISHFMMGLIYKTPTPGGLRKAASQAIYYAAEDYAYALSKGADPGSPHMLEAAEHLHSAISEYRSFTGIMDAVSLNFCTYTPEGFNKIVSECISSTDHVQLALSGGKKAPAAFTIM